MAFEELVSLYSEMRSDPDNLEKQVAYFRALADARLTDYYVISEKLMEAKQVIVTFARKSYTQVASTRQVHIPFEEWDDFRDYALKLNKLT